MCSKGVSHVKIDEHSAGQRIDNFLVKHLKGVPKSRLYRILRKGEVRVNKKRAKPDYRLCLGDEVRIPPVRLSDDITPITPDRKSVQLLEGRIIYEDDGLIVLNKPAGMAVHKGTGVHYGLIDILKIMYPNEHFSLVHRLDRGTSGCLMVAKKRDVLLALHAALQADEVTKTYTLLTKGYWGETQTTVDAALIKNQFHAGEHMVELDEEGKEAVTHFTLIAHFPMASLLTARIETGRTHQIRVHAKSLGHPIAGDDKYGDVDFNKEMRQHGLRRIFLHASELSLVIPGTQERVLIQAPLDQALEAVLKELS